MKNIAHAYWFWLIVCGILCLFLETLFRWRKNQKFLRPQLWQDIIFLALNGHLIGLWLAYLGAWIINQVLSLFTTAGILSPYTANWLTHVPLVWQFIIFLLVKDFLEWCVHNLLHRVNFLWEIHKLHHSIIYMDWIGNFRFHWLEIVIYRTLTWLPLTLMGVSPEVLLPIAVLTTIIGNLNHANIRIDWGPLVYLINSSRMHIWHHDKICHKKNGQNFGIVFSLWDWLFHTAYLPHEAEQPQQLGFYGMNRFPLNSPLQYQLWPFIRSFNQQQNKEQL